MKTGMPSPSARLRAAPVSSSGVPKGRPSGAKNLSTLFIEALNETVIIAENGGRRVSASTLKGVYHVEAAA